MGQKYLFSIFLCYNFKKTIFVFEISILEFLKLRSFVKKNKMDKFLTKNVSFGLFSAGSSRQYFHIGNHHPRISLTAKFCEVMKIP